MGLIKEPKDVDFTVESKPWSAKELADFRKLMQKLKSGKKPVAKTTRLLKIKDTSTHVNPSRPLDLDALFLRAGKVKVKGKKTA